MKVSLNWLRDFVDIDVTEDELCARLVSCGFEVEEVIRLADNCKRVVVGRIEGLEKHPDADKLQICRINVGDEVIQIVTGANNIKVGDLIPVALDNSYLPTGTKIKKGKLRGVESNGMLCSGEELKLTEADYKGAGEYGILILREDYPLGMDINEVFGNNDVVLDIGVTANRPDCNSVIGIAREVATLLKKPLKMPKMTYKVNSSDISEYVTVDVKATDLCPRYMASVVKNIKIGDSPKYIQNRLKAVGLRPINNIVDITNYVLIEMGQPMHSFDRDRLCGSKIVVRRADEGEKIVTLDNKEHTLDSSMLVIADSEKPQCVAGVMGGLGSGISEETNTVVFESAKFMRDNIRRTSRKLNLRSDSSFRFERGIDIATQEYGMRRALALIDECGCGEIVCGTIDVLSASLEKKTVTTTFEKIDSILGIKVPETVVVDILNSLSIETEVKDGVITAVAPLFREDIENANDLAEEIIRLYGYDHINCTLIDKGKQTLGGKPEDVKDVDRIRNILVANGMSETLTYSFTSPKIFDILTIKEDSGLRNTVKLLNPLGEDLSVMRTTLAYSIMNTMRSNIVKSVKCGRFFEIANVYLPKDMPVSEQPDEIRHVVMGVFGRDEDFYSMKGIVENILDKFGIVDAEYEYTSLEWLHSGRGADIKVENDILGYVGEVHPTVLNNLGIKEKLYIADINIETLGAVKNTQYVFESIPKYPSVERDIAVLVKESVSAKNIIKTVKTAGGNLLKSVDIFDVYRGGQVAKGMKSVAISLEFRLPDRTLTEEEVNQKINKILKRLEVDLEATLR